MIERSTNLLPIIYLSREFISGKACTCIAITLTLIYMWAMVRFCQWAKRWMLCEMLLCVCISELSTLADEPKRGCKLLYLKLGKKDTPSRWGIFWFDVYEDNLSYIDFTLAIYIFSCCSHKSWRNFLCLSYAFVVFWELLSLLLIMELLWTFA